MAKPEMPETQEAPDGVDGPQLESLVDRTTGLQPARRLFHMANGVVIASVLAWSPVPRSWAVWILGAVLAGLVTMDVVRLTTPRANALFFKAFRHLASPREAKGLASSTWYTLGVLLAVALLPREAAITGILVLALADPSASYVGRRWGRRPFLGASLEGTLIFVGVAFAILAPRHGFLVAAVAAPAAALVERYSWPVDDNLTIPVASAAAVLLLESFP